MYNDNLSAARGILNALAMAERAENEMMLKAIFE